MAARRPLVDTSRHSIEDDCLHCEENGTGVFAQREVLKKHRTDVLTDSLYLETVDLCLLRGSVGTRKAAA